MIVVDTSAAIAMILKEPGHEVLAAHMFADQERMISPVALLEATMMLSRMHPAPKTVLESYLRSANIVVCTIDRVQADISQDAFLNFGKGRHGARLNFGDCFSYAAAKSLNAPLLFVGDDFSKTDVKTA